MEILVKHFETLSLSTFHQVKRQTAKNIQFFFNYLRFCFTPPRLLKRVRH